MCGEVAGMGRQSALRQIGGRADRELALIVRDRQCDHVLLDDLAEPYAGIVAELTQEACMDRMEDMLYSVHI
jgi:hypothetical protein